VNNIVVLSIFVAGMYCLYRYIKALETDIAKIREDMNGNQTICARPVPQNDGAVFVAAKKLEEANEIWGEDEDDDESIHSAELANMLRAVLSDASEEKANEPAYNVSIEEDTTSSSFVKEDTTSSAVEEDTTMGSSSFVKEDTTMGSSSFVKEDTTSSAVEEDTTMGSSSFVEEDTTSSSFVEEDMTSSAVEEGTTVEKLDTQEDPLPPLETHEVKALLAKKTNDELRTILKERGSTNLKGNKAELIQRLLSE
jgi:predicted transcriptional regulator